MPAPQSLTSVAEVTGTWNTAFSSPPQQTTAWPQAAIGGFPGASSFLEMSQPQAYSPAPAGLTLSPAAETFPRRLVDKVRSGVFVDMKELLADNVSLLDQLETLQGPAAIRPLGPARPRLREVTTLHTWCYCFLAYISMCTTDATTRDQLAYARLIIKEAQRHGGLGWLDYDRAFRQQAAADPAIRWNTLLPGLQASTILGQPAVSGQ